MAKAKRYTSESFEILQIMLAPPNMRAVYAIEVEEGSDLHRLEPHQFDLLGVAEVTTRFWEGEYPNQRQYRPEDKDRRIVAIELADGYFHILNEDSNFAGVCRDGQDIETCIGELSLGQFKLAPPVAAE